MSKPVLQSTQSIIINAPLDKVWNIQSDISQWPTWQSDISYTHIDGPIKKGTIFTWKALGMPITSRLERVDNLKCIGWIGTSIGMNAEHMWYFEAIGDKTKVQTTEKLSGWLTQILRIIDKNFLEKSLKKSLLSLRNAAEQ